VPLFFCGCSFFIFVLQIKRTGMLKGISWWQFSIFITMMTGIYYLYVFIRFYGTEIMGKIMKGGWKSKGPEWSASERGRERSEERTRPKTVDQTELFEKAGTDAGDNEQLQLMHRAIAVIRQVIAQGLVNKLDRENMMDHIKEVLGDYGGLCKTEYAEEINKFLVRVCAADLSLELGEEDLAALWK